MALTSPSPNPNPNPSSGQGQGQGQGQEQQRDLASATALLASLAPRLRALLAQNPLRVPLGRLATMQPDPARAHVLYAEPDMRSTDGRRLLAVCGACCFCFFLTGQRISYPSPPVSSPGEGMQHWSDLIFLELAHGAFKEAGFLADDRPLKVRPHP
jgi:hypothetical protein